MADSGWVLSDKREGNLMVSAIRLSDSWMPGQVKVNQSDSI